jgi:hypothetical protein
MLAGFEMKERSETDDAPFTGMTVTLSHTRLHDAEDAGAAVFHPRTSIAPIQTFES